MFNGDWRSSFRIGGVGFYVLATAVVCIGAFLYSTYRHHDEYEKASHVDTKHAVAVCTSGEKSVPDMTCVIEALKTQSEQQNNAADLKAQQEMATWALLMFIVTGSGVIFVAQTLEATRRAVAEAEKATDAAVETVHVTREAAHTERRAQVSVLRARPKI